MDEWLKSRQEHQGLAVGGGQLNASALPATSPITRATAPSSSPTAGVVSSVDPATYSTPPRYSQSATASGLLQELADADRLRLEEHQRHTRQLDTLRSELARAQRRLEESEGHRQELAQQVRMERRAAADQRTADQRGAAALETAAVTEARREASMLRAQCDAQDNAHRAFYAQLQEQMMAQEQQVYIREVG